MKRFHLAIFASILPILIYSQSSDLIQFSGITLASGRDSLEPASFILVKNNSRKSGAYSNAEGYFSIVVARGDTIEFSSVGYMKSKLIIPSSIQKDKFYTSWLMLRDTLMLPSVIIVPWKNIEDLRRAVIDLKLSETDLAIAYQNLQYERWSRSKEQFDIDADDARSNALAFQNNENQMRSGLSPINNILNPIAWMQFINYLDSKKKKKSKANINDKYEE